MKNYAYLLGYIEQAFMGFAQDHPDLFKDRESMEKFEELAKETIRKGEENEYRYSNPAISDP